MRRAKTSSDPDRCQPSDLRNQYFCKSTRRGSRMARPTTDGRSSRRFAVADIARIFAFGHECENSHTPAHNGCSVETSLAMAGLRSGLDTTANAKACRGAWQFAGRAGGSWQPCPRRASRRPRHRAWSDAVLDRRRFCPISWAEMVEPFGAVRFGLPWLGRCVGRAEAVVVVARAHTGGTASFR